MAMLGGECSECCVPCGDRPPFVRLEHSIPSSDGGGDWYQTLAYCMDSVPTVLAVGNLAEQQGGTTTLVIPCCYFGEINGCSLPSRSTFGFLSGVRKVIVDVDQRRLFIWYAQRVSFGTSFGFIQQPILHAVAAECDLTASTGQLVGSFTTVAVDPILNQQCLVQSGQSIDVYADSGPASPSYRDGGLIPVYKDTGGAWWPGQEIRINISGEPLPKVYEDTTGALEPGDYVLSHSAIDGSECAPGYVVNVNGWKISAFMRTYKVDTSVDGTRVTWLACSGCSHSWDVVINNQSTYLIRYSGIECGSEWGGDVAMGDGRLIPTATIDSRLLDQLPQVTVYG